MIGSFESMVRRAPQRTCFTFVDEAGNESAYSYREVRMLAAALARFLQTKGVGRDECVVVDLPNSPLFVLLMLAASYGNFTLVTLNNRLSGGEKLSRVLELERSLGVRIAYRVDGNNAAMLWDRSMRFLAGEESPQVRAATAARPSFIARAKAATADPRTTRALGRTQNTRAARRRRDEVSLQDALEEIIHFAERSAHVFDAKTRALIMFTSGTTGKPKAVSLSWNCICSAAEASNTSLNTPGEGMWQAALPLYHIGGFQVVVRSFMADTPFILYERFKAERVLEDAQRSRATHISVVDKMLQDLLACDNASVLKNYRCILLGGAATNPQTLARAQVEGIRLFASYGMTETSSQIAHAQVTASFNGGMRLLPGYDVHVIDPDEGGYGRLAVKGPGVFEGYLNARAAYTVDGYFLTGDTGAMIGSRLYVKERTADMFVSGGENIYPAEIRAKLMNIPAILDAHVFGAPDPVWGRRPVAFVERGLPREQEKADQASENAARLWAATTAGGNYAAAADGPTPQQFGAAVQGSLAPRLSKLYQPRHVCVLDEFPRLGVGKTDCTALESLYEQRIEVVRVTLHHVRLPFVKPFQTAKGTLHTRESVLVEVEDYAGRIGLGECVAFETDWYLPETLEQDVRVISELLAPLVMSEIYLHPREVSASFATCAAAAPFPLAQGALEPALWDLYGKIVGKPLWQLIGGSAQAAENSVQVAVPAGAVIGMGSQHETLAAVSRSVEQGYSRVKLKVAPGASVAIARAVREQFPQLMITLDANQSFTERNMDELLELDKGGFAWIEEPLNPRRLPAVGPTNIYERLARLQRELTTPLCLDESFANPKDLTNALRREELRCYALKIAKLGGIQPALDFVRIAREKGIRVWMGGMYDTGVSKRVHAAFETLPGVEAAGDIGATARYFSCDITDPPYTAERGQVALNRPHYEEGIGCNLNHSSLASVLVNRTVIAPRV